MIDHLRAVPLMILEGFWAGIGFWSAGIVMLSGLALCVIRNWKDS